VANTLRAGPPLSRLTRARGHATRRARRASAVCDSVITGQTGPHRPRLVRQNTDAPRSPRGHSPSTKTHRLGTPAALEPVSGMKSCRSVMDRITPRRGGFVRQKFRQISNALNCGAFSARPVCTAHAPARPRPTHLAVSRAGACSRAGTLRFATDREQAAFLIDVMAEERPEDLARAYATAMEVGPRWRAHIGNSLKRIPDTKAILESLGA